MEYEAGNTYHLDVEVWDQAISFHETLAVVFELQGIQLHGLVEERAGPRVHDTVNEGYKCVAGTNGKTLSTIMRRCCTQ